MGNSSSALPRGRMTAAAMAAVLAASLASCGLFAGSDGPPGPSAAAGSSAGAEDGSQRPAGATPRRTADADAGQGARLSGRPVHLRPGHRGHAGPPQLWQQAREDARAAGAAGLDFGPLLEGQRRYIETSDLAICHLETPVAGPDGPFSGVSLVQCSAADHHRHPGRRLPGLHHGQQPHH